MCAETAARYLGAIAACLLIPVLLCAAGAALGETYKGVLVTPGSDLSIPIVIDFKNVGGSLSGKIKTSSPLTLEGPIAAGEKIGLTCNLRSKLSVEVGIVMSGTCLTASYEGKFLMTFPKRGRRPGTFKLTAVVQAEESAANPTTDPFARKGPTVGAITACLNENSTCMVACPHEDRTAEFLCSNACIAKYDACKAKKK